MHLLDPLDPLFCQIGAEFIKVWSILQLLPALPYPMQSLHGQPHLCEFLQLCGACNRPVCGAYSIAARSLELHANPWDDRMLLGRFSMIWRRWYAASRRCCVRSLAQMRSASTRLTPSMRWRPPAATRPILAPLPAPSTACARSLSFSTSSACKHGWSG